MNLADIQNLRAQPRHAPASSRKTADEVYDLAELGIWARDVVMPLLRKLPPQAEMRLPNPNGTDPIVSTVEAEVAKAFEACPQK